MKFTIILWALLGGVIPALLWLWFYLHEDKKRPEPRGRIFITFIAGMLSTLVVLPIEQFIESHVTTTTLLIILWATAEEVLKYLAAYFTALRTKVNNEPIDALIYLVTAALGFAAMENALFLLTPLGDGQIAQTIITGNMRFIGATVLHTLSSGVIGALVAFSYYKKSLVKKEFVLIGLILATGLHTAFNLLIMRSTGGSIFSVFFLVWIAVGILFLLFEKAKTIHPRKLKQIFKK